MKEGDVCVSLCRGQGGTAADAPMRQWSDSWQVVAMAAYSDLILSNTVPFVAKDFPEYSCTGFRYVFICLDLLTMRLKNTKFSLCASVSHFALIGYQG